MDTFAPFLAKVETPAHLARFTALFAWIAERYPNLTPALKWNQPMYTDHGTFIIGFSMAKHNIAVAPELHTMNRFAQDIAAAGYTSTKELIRIRWEQPVDYALLAKLIEFNMRDKAECRTFWRT